MICLELLRQRIEHAGYTFASFAAALGIPRSSLNAYLWGHKPFPAKHYLEVFRLIGLLPHEYVPALAEVYDAAAQTGQFTITRRKGG